MSKESLKNYANLACLLALIAIWPALTSAQVSVDDSSAAVETGAEEIPLLSASDLEVLVGRIALYPDDLLAIVLPASTYPLQLVQAERFLQDLKNDPELKPDESWDDSVVALINYPEVVELLTKDLDKTWRLGEAVVAQQADVITAIETFRDQAYAAGNLQSDTHQTVSQNDGVIEITPVEEDVIYVPYYEPERVVVYQPTPAYYYYPRPYPVYNYPYPYGYSFNHGFFWGVTTAFAIGWYSDSLHVYHHSYYGHPYYGHSYGYNYWYRQPSIHAHNNYYYNSHHTYNSGDRYGHGDYWRPHSGSTVNAHDQRVTRSRHYPGTRSGSGSGGGESEAVSFRQRPATISNQSSSIKPTQTRTASARTSQSRSTQGHASQSSSKKSVSRSAVAKQERSDIKFRERTSSTVKQVAPSRSAKSQASIKFRERPASAPQQLAFNKSSRPSRSSSQPSRSSGQSSRPSSQPSRSSKQPSRSSSQPSRSSSQPSRSSSPQKSQPSYSGNSGNSGSNKVASTSRSKSSQRSGNRH